MKYGEFERRVQAIIQAASEELEIEASIPEQPELASAFTAFQLKVAADVAWLVHTEIEPLESDVTTK